jgi:hypothetical protein
VGRPPPRAAPSPRRARRARWPSIGPSCPPAGGRRRSVLSPSGAHPAPTRLGTRYAARAVPSGRSPRAAAAWRLPIHACTARGVIPYLRLPRTSPATTPVYRPALYATLQYAPLVCTSYTRTCLPAVGPRGAPAARDNPLLPLPRRAVAPRCVAGGRVPRTATTPVVLPPPPGKCARRAGAGGQHRGRGGRGGRPANGAHRPTGGVRANRHPPRPPPPSDGRARPPARPPAPQQGRAAVLEQPQLPQGARRAGLSGAPGAAAGPKGASRARRGCRTEGRSCRAGGARPRAPADPAPIGCGGVRARAGAALPRGGRVWARAGAGQRAWTRQMTVAPGRQPAASPARHKQSRRGYRHHCTTPRPRTPPYRATELPILARAPGQRHVVSAAPPSAPA